MSSQGHHVGMDLMVRLVTPDFSVDKRFPGGLFGWHYPDHILVVHGQEDDLGLGSHLPCGRLESCMYAPLVRAGRWRRTADWQRAHCHAL